MSWDIDEKEFYETFAEIESDRGIEDAKLWAWSALDWTQKELRKKEEGAKEERAAVVSWLRSEAEAENPFYTQSNLDYTATMIERGEHRREEKE
jgi:hypothetical protein